MVKTIPSVESLIEEQRQYFYSGQTKQIYFRKQQLSNLKNAIVKYEKEIIQALFDDLHKSEFEAYATEIGLVLESLGFMIKNIDNWAKPVPTKTPIQFQPGKSFIVHDPYGVVCIIAPFNFPFQLVMEPLMGAIVGGNTAIIKPSEYSVHTTAIIKKIVEEINHVKEGLRRVFFGSAGSARSAFADADFTAAGKTGTAQVVYYGPQQEKYGTDTINIVNVGFAPFDDPEIAYAVIFPWATTNFNVHLSNANRTARELLDYYFELKKKYADEGLSTSKVDKPIIKDSDEKLDEDEEVKTVNE